MKSNSLLRLFSILLLGLGLNQPIKAVSWTQEELQGLTVEGENPPSHNMKFLSAIHNDYKQLKKNYPVDSRGYLTFERYIHMTNIIAKKHNINAKKLFEIAYPKEAFIEEEKTEIVLQHFAKNETLPLLIHLKLFRGLTFDQKKQLLIFALRKNEAARKKFLISSKSEIKLFSPHNNSEIDKIFFFRKRGETSKLVILYVVLPDLLEFKIKTSSDEIIEIQLSKPVFDKLTVLDFKMKIAKKIGIPPDQIDAAINKIILMKKTIMLSNEKKISDYLNVKKADVNEIRIVWGK